MPARPRSHSGSRRLVHERAGWLTIGAFAAASVSVIQFVHPRASELPRPFSVVPQVALAAASASPLAFGKSGEVRLRTVLPGSEVDYPLAVSGDPATLRYQWLRVADGVLVDSAHSLAEARLHAPHAPGFYRLALVQGARRHVVSDLTLAVLVPFEAKLGSTLNGYRIGTYLAERLAGRRAPEGFLQVGSTDLGLRITKHLTMGDFLSHDDQQSWPRYVALDPKLLDKMELVMAQVAEWRGQNVTTLAVQSGFRSPAHNRTVRRAARDSRHQYGDAADVAIDADGDGRVTLADIRLVAIAVELVEQEYPELVGGLGIYTSRRYSAPYLHIDARGRRARWRG